MKIAIIPARGGSVRIPHKNIKKFHGKPIIAYSIEVALECGLFDRVIVSTDDDEISEVARSYGAETPFQRPDELATDIIGTNAVIKHAIKWFIDNNEKVSFGCGIYATAPFVKSEYLHKGS